MKSTLLILLFLFFSITGTYSQAIVLPTVLAGKMIKPDNGFLPGNKFPFYPTVNRFNFQGKKIRVEVLDERIKRKLLYVNCSNLDLTNSSELWNPLFIYRFGDYIDTVFHQSGIATDTTVHDTLYIKLEAIDARQLGSGNAKMHGLCQVSIQYKSFSKEYCDDIQEGDKNSPLSGDDFSTRKTAIRYLGSAAMRDVVEQFLTDFIILK